MSKKKTTEEFKQEVYNLVGDEYTVQGEYTTNRDNIKMKHNTDKEGNICGYEWPITPSHFLQGERCPKCRKIARKTTDQYKKEVHDLVGDEYTVLGEYKTNRDHIKMKHNTDKEGNICGYEWPITPNHFLQGERCPECRRKASRKTTDQYKKEVYDLVGDEYEVRGEYTTAGDHIMMRHNKCGYEYPVRPNSFLHGDRCPKCRKKARKTTEKYRNEVYELVGDEYTVSGEYIRSDLPVDMRHKCGYKWPVTPSNFLHNNTRCPNCEKRTANKKKTKLHLQKAPAREEQTSGIANISIGYPKRGLSSCEKTAHYQQMVSQRFGDEYVVLGDYKDVNTPVKMRHKICGHEWEPRPALFLRKDTPCQVCSGWKRNTTRFKQKVHDLVGDEYLVLGEYVKDTEDILMKHVYCGCEWPVNANDFINKGSRCPQCKESKGETAVRLYLDEIKQTYEREYKFSDLYVEDSLGTERDKLKFDFLVDKDGRIMAIEFDGEQHFQPDEYFGGIDKFERTRMYDETKTKYCEQNNIPLLRIKYNQKNEIPSMIEDLMNRSDFYVSQHNTYLTNEEYYAGGTKNFRKLPKYVSRHMQSNL